jgi:hypothetical protein
MEHDGNEVLGARISLITRRVRNKVSGYCGVNRGYYVPGGPPSITASQKAFAYIREQKS